MSRLILSAIIGALVIVALGVLIGLQILVVSGQQATKDQVGTSAREIATSLLAFLDASTAVTEGADTPSNPPDRGAVVATLAANAALAPIDRVLRAPNLTLRSDPSLLLDFVEQNPFAIGFVDHSAISPGRDTLRIVPLLLDGKSVEPTLETIRSGAYPLTRIFYVYTAVDVLQSQPEVAAFLGCYLSRLNEHIIDVGFFPPRQSVFAEAVRTYKAAVGGEPATEVATCSLVNSDGARIDVSGSEIVSPITRHMAALYRADGFTGDIQFAASSSTEGFEQLCAGTTDIVNADRPIETPELSNCLDNGHIPLSFAIAESAISIVVNSSNTSVKQLTNEQVQQLLAGVYLWSEVNSAWPSEPVVRALPSQQSGAFGALMSHVFGYAGRSASTTFAAESTPTGTSIPSMETSARSPTHTREAAAIPLTEPTATVGPTATQEPTITPNPTATSKPTVTPAPTATVIPLAPAHSLILGYIHERAECTIFTEIVAHVLAENFDYTITMISLDEPDELYSRLAWNDVELADRLDASVCYIDRDDRPYLRQHGAALTLLGDGYANVGERKLYIIIQASLVPIIRADNSCVYDFLRSVRLETVESLDAGATEWVNNNRDFIDTWTACLTDS